MKSHGLAVMLLTFAVSVGGAMLTHLEIKTRSTSVSFDDATTNDIQVISPSVSEDEFVPVDNMHHFMEYICEPSYKGLKQVLAEKPADRAAWKTFKNHALVLAETSALVATRVPDDESKAEQWKQISLKVHQTGTALYKSSGNYEESRKQFHLMIDQCNQCHQVFAEGKHQLEK